MANHVAPEGQVYVCGACGKMSQDKYGMQRISRGWDESCMLNSVLCYTDKLVMNESKSLVLKVEDGGVVEEKK
jgi:hypothetical protein